MSAAAVQLLIPEIVLVAAAIAIYLLGAFFHAPRAWSWLSGVAIVVSSVCLAMQQGGAIEAEPVILDALAYYARWLALAFGILLAVFTSSPLSTPGTPEYKGSLLLSIAGLMLVAGANELVLIFVSLELISIPTYIILYLGRRGAESQEAAAKYFFLSLLSSAMLLYGFTFLYGAAGSTYLTAIHAALASPTQSAANLARFSQVALVLVFAGLGFRIAAVPFHFYAPDVYQGTTHANAALLSVIPKAAGLLVLVRITAAAMPAIEPYAWRIALVMSVLTMTLGNLLALWQENLRRLLAYSSIAHAGYMLIALAAALAPTSAGESFSATGMIFFYLSIYAVATIGTFAALDYLGRADGPLQAVEELAGLRRTQPLVAAAIAVFMFSLTGIPPLAGFQGKLVVFFNALSFGPQAPSDARPWFIALAVIGVLNAAISAGYYLRIVSVMYFRTPLATPRPEGGLGPAMTTAACAILTIALGIYPGPLLHESDAVGRDRKVQHANAWPALDRDDDQSASGISPIPRAEGSPTGDKG